MSSIQNGVERCLLAGGPCHGRILEMNEARTERERHTLSVADSGPVREYLLADSKRPPDPPKPPLWKRVVLDLIGLGWKPPAELAPPLFDYRVSVYRLTTVHGTGQPFAGCSIYWYEALRNGAPPPPPPPPEWLREGELPPPPRPATILGVPIVTGEGWGPPVLIQPAR